MQAMMVTSRLRSDQPETANGECIHSRLPEALPCCLGPSTGLMKAVVPNTGNFTPFPAFCYFPPSMLELVVHDNQCPMWIWAPWTTCSKILHSSVSSHSSCPNLIRFHTIEKPNILTFIFVHSYIFLLSIVDVFTSCCNHLPLKKRTNIADSKRVE